MTPSPLNGNAVLTTATATFVTAIIVYVLRHYGYELTGDQQNALIQALQQPIGDIIVAIVFWVSTIIARSRVSSELTVSNLMKRLPTS